MSIQLPIALPNRLPETIVSTDAIEQLNPFVSASNQPGESLQPYWRKRDYLIGGVCVGQKCLTAMPLLVGDLLAILGCHFSAALMIIALRGISMPADYLLQGWATAIVFAGAGFMIGLYPATAVSPVVELRQTVITGWLSFATIMMLNQMLATLSPFEMLVGVTAAMLASILVPLVRNIVRHHFSRYRWWGERVIIIGSGVQGQAIYRFYQKSLHRGLKPIGIVDSAASSARDVTKTIDLTIPCLGQLDQIADFSRRNHVQWCIITSNDCENLNIQETLRHYARVSNIIIIPPGVLLPSLWSSSRECAGMMGVHITDHYRSPIARLGKRSFDIIAAALGIIAVSPVFLIVYGWLKLVSPGPIFFSQHRVGRDGKTFRMLKFRTMIMDADKRLDEILQDAPDLRLEWFETQKLKNDPRIIKGIGRILRKSSLDELPQLWNVLIGEMSLVGPRPIPIYEEKLYREYGTQFQLYLRVTPGITGLWQVSGRNHTSYLQRVRLDGYYVCNWSPWLDYYILLRTIRTVVLAEGAY